MRLFFALTMLMLSSAAANELSPFTSDGCSAFPDGTLAQRELWLACCQEHDLAYWQGGTLAQRIEADVRLHQCVTAVGEPEIAMVMLAGVTVGGTPYLPTDFRWGYGWPFPRGYQPLSGAEQQAISDALGQLQKKTPLSGK